MASKQVLLISFSGFEEVENVSKESEAGAAISFSNRHEKHKLGRWRWYLASYQASLNSVKRFQRWKWKSLILWEDGAEILFFYLTKTKTLVDDVKIMLPVKLRSIPFGGFKEEIENASANDRLAVAAILSFRSARNTHTGWRKSKSCFLSCFVEFPSAVSEKSKMSQPIGRGCYLSFPIGQKTPQTSSRLLRTGLLSGCVKFCSEEKSNMSQPIR